LIDNTMHTLVLQSQRAFFLWDPTKVIWIHSQTYVHASFADEWL